MSNPDVPAGRPSGTQWWADAVVYQIYPRSFADGNGDGMGDLRGVKQRLPYLQQLGVDAVWLSPFYKSPQADAGYDVADYRQVDPLFGSLADFDAMWQEAHQRGLKVIVDLVPNHTSDEHAWFQEALAAPPGSPERDRYIFRPGKDGAPVPETATGRPTTGNRSSADLPGAGPPRRTGLRAIGTSTSSTPSSRT
jgi:alpha-glucosidase